MITQITVLTWLVRTLNWVSAAQRAPVGVGGRSVTECTPMSCELARSRTDVRAPGPSVDRVAP